MVTLGGKKYSEPLPPFLLKQPQIIMLAECFTFTTVYLCL
jgi:hypothetical protein